MKLPALCKLRIIYRCSFIATILNRSNIKNLNYIYFILISKFEQLSSNKNEITFSSDFNLKQMLNILRLKNKILKFFEILAF